MAAARHVGKVLIKVGTEGNSMSSASLALPQYYCLKDKSYIILGGLGGFGLELGRIHVPSISSPFKKSMLQSNK